MLSLVAVEILRPPYERHTFAFWKGYIKKNLSTLTGCLPNTRHVSGAILGSQLSVYLPNDCRPMSELR